MKDVMVNIFWVLIAVLPFGLVGGLLCSVVRDKYHNSRYENAAVMGAAGIYALAVTIFLALVFN